MTRSTALPLLLVFAPLCLSQKYPPASSSDPRAETVTKRATEARAAGSTEVTFSLSSGSLQEYSTGLASALSKYSAIVGTPRAVQIVDESKQSLSTWYSISVEQRLSSRPPVMQDSLLLSSLPLSLKPTHLLPVLVSRILLVASGGSIVINGIKVNQRENGQQSLQIGSRYLFIIDCSPDRLARLPFGAWGIVLVKQPGDRLSPITTSPHLLTKDISSGAFDTLAKVSELLSSRHR